MGFQGSTYTSKYNKSAIMYSEFFENLDIFMKYWISLKKDLKEKKPL
jgi:predicted GIY-YIG superfamily endonuclease